ncbi:MAG: sulfite exporter TauE/SafE family protein [Planctomycetota bacterium]
MSAILDALTSLVPDDTPVVWALVAMAGGVIVTGLAKSGFGGGVGILAVPLLAVALDASVAVGVMLPILIAADIVAVVQHRRHVSSYHLRWSLVGGAVGIALGSALLWWFQGRGDGGNDALKTVLNLTVGGTCLVLVGLQAYRGLGGRVPRIPRSRTAASSSGGLAGFVSTLAHAAGPIMTVYILDQGLAKRAVVGTLVFYFFCVNLGKLPTFVGLELIDWSTLAASAALIPLVPLGSWIGLRLNERVPERPFVQVMYAGAAAAGVWLVVKEIGGLVGA